jgi:hypothetical protein
MDPLENKTVVQVICSKLPRVLGFKMNFFPQLMQRLLKHSLRSASVRRSVVNLLIYLADQLLRGFQSADNQFQALQNQEIEVFFSVHGSHLSELKAEVVQIQLFIWFALRYLISVDQQ